jgi:tRNA G18 (ribose-2'-O)-methylase SpoU
MSKDFYLIAHNIRSLHNVGSFFRTADCLGVNKIFLTGYTGTPEEEKHRNKITKTALGAENTVPWEKRKAAGALIKKLQSQGVQVVALENNVRGRKVLPLKKFRPKFPLAVIVGEETKGIPKSVLAMADKIVEIPMLGQKESLNVSVAFGVVAYHISSC